MDLDTIKDNVHHFLNGLATDIVAESGVASDKYHLGKFILKSLKDAPDFIMQIDGGTGESETFKSVLERSVRCATCLRSLGLKNNDIIVLMAPNHLDLAIPIYACLYLGVSIAVVDMTFGTSELQESFKQCAPKVVFCQSEKAKEVQQALSCQDFDCHIVTFGETDNFLSFPKFLKKYSDDSPVDEFKANDFDTSVTNCLLLPTSGSTGSPKSAVLTHENIFIGFAYFLAMYTNFPTPFRLAFVPSPLQWMTATFHFVFSPILRYTRMHTSLPLTQEHAYYLINKYKPTYMIANPTFATLLIKPGDRENCDFSCLQHFTLAGSAVSTALFAELKKVMPNATIHAGIGITEGSGFILDCTGATPGSLGRPIKHLEYKLVNFETQEEITEPNVPGELWIRGQVVFKGYYKKPEVTAETLTEDGWLKTGDILYRDENNYYFFVDRLKVLMKYNNHHVSPVEIEEVISKYPGVFEVAVTGLSSVDHGELPVACVVPLDGFKLTAQEIKDLVKESLTDTKQLRGGVVFMKSLPKTSNGKMNRAEIKRLVTILKRE